MQELPELVSNKLNELRLKYPYKIQLRVINGKFCIYKDRYKYIKETKKSKVISEYLGRIDNNGIFIEKKKKRKSALDKAIEVIKEHGGTVALPESNNNILESKKSILDEADKKILMALSMNSRIQRKYISQMCGLSQTAVTHRIKKFEETGFIRYELELFNLSKIGFNTYMFFIKFLDKKPTSEIIRDAFKDDPKVQLVIITKGEYDVIIYYLEESNIALFLKPIQKLNTLLNRYPSKWYLTPISESYGLVQIRQEFFDVLKEKVINKRKIDDKNKTIKYKEYATLRELNENSTTSFSEIDKKYNLPYNSSHYTYDDLISEKKEIILRPTINIIGLKPKYFAMIYFAITNWDKFNETKNEWRKIVIAYNKYTNSFSLIFDIGIPNGGALIIPVYENELEVIEKQMLNVKGIELNSLIITEVLIGSINVRLFDNNHSVQFGNLVKSKTIKSAKLVDYKLTKNEMNY